MKSNILVTAAVMAASIACAEAACGPGMIGGTCKTKSGKFGSFACTNGKPVCVVSDEGDGRVPLMPITGRNVPELRGLDPLVLAWANKYGFQAVTVAVVKNNRLVYEKGYGYMDKNRTRPTEPGARMRLATNSISLTKRALKQLIDDGAFKETDLVYQVVDLGPSSGKYADPRMMLISIHDLIDDRSCFVDPQPNNYQVGQSMSLGRNATSAERIQHLWAQPSTMQLQCTVGQTNSFSHYAMEIAGEIIARKNQLFLDDADPVGVGDSYGDYVHNHVGAPIGANFSQAKNLEAELQPHEVWYKSLDNCDPEWNRNWVAGQSKVSCAYGIDFFARPGSGTLVSAGRDFARYLVKYFPDGTKKPKSLIGYEFDSTGFGSLAGTSSIIVHLIEKQGNSTSFVVLANARRENLPPGAKDTASDEIASNIRSYLKTVVKWPAIDLF